MRNITVIEKSGDCAPACEIVYLDDFSGNGITIPLPEKGKFSPQTLEASETSWLEAKRRRIENDTPANKWAEGILHLAFKAVWRAADD